MLDKDFNKEFKKCPVCELHNLLLDLLPIMSKKHKRRQPLPFFGELAKELVARGIASPDWNFALDGKQGVVVDPLKQATIPIGAELPGYQFETDICTECGCVYAKKLMRKIGHKTLPAVKKQLPTILQLKDLPGQINNPRLS